MGHLVTLIDQRACSTTHLKYLPVYSEQLTSKEKTLPGTIQEKSLDKASCCRDSRGECILFIHLNICMSNICNEYIHANIIINAQRIYETSSGLVEGCIA